MEHIERVKPEQSLYPSIASELNAMREKDQEVRLREVLDWQEIEEVDRVHTARLKEIIAQIGWPNFSKVGDLASKNAWLLAQHADLDRDFQEQCLALMLAEPEGEVRKRDIAYLTDRILVAKGLPQRYGSQFYKNKETGKDTLRDVEDPANLESRRAEMELEPIAEYLESFAEMYNGDPKELGLGNFEPYFIR